MGTNPLITTFGALYMCGALLEIIIPLIYIPFFLIALIVTLIKKPTKYKLVRKHGSYVMKKRFFTVKNMLRYNIYTLASLVVGTGYFFLFRHLGLIC